jgi:hypothetical protein
VVAQAYFSRFPPPQLRGALDREFLPHDGSALAAMDGQVWSSDTFWCGVLVRALELNACCEFALWILPLLMQLVRSHRHHLCCQCHDWPPPLACGDHGKVISI